MSSTSILSSVPLTWRRGLARQQRLFVAVGAFIAIFVYLDFISPGPVSYFEISFLFANAGPLALAAMGQTIVFLIRGFDLSCGATMALVNVMIALYTRDTAHSQILMCVAGLGMGAAVGAFNGFFIAFMRLQPVVVTLATMFIILGLNLLIMPDPGGMVPYGITQMLTGDLIYEVIPASLVVLLIALLVWALIKRSRFGTALYAVGSNEDAAFSNGISVTRTKFFGYVLAGGFYGAGGVFLSAQTLSGDPLVGSGLLLLIFSATILGGTRIGGGQGGCVGTVFAALTLMLISNVMLVLNISSHFTPIVEGIILLLAVAGATLGKDSPLSGHWQILKLNITGLSNRTLPQFLDRPEAQRGKLRTTWKPRVSDELTGSTLRQWRVKNWETLRLIIPAWVLLLVAYVLVLVLIGGSAWSTHYFNSLFTLALFFAVLGLGQGAVVMTGGLDLSVPHTMAFTGVMLAALSNGMDGPAYWAIPVVLAVGIGIGIVNGLGIVLFGMPAIVVTLATNGVMQGLGLLYTGGIPTGRSPPVLVWLFTGRFLGFAPSVWLLIVFVAISIIVIHRTTFGRRIFALGNSSRVSLLSGVRVDRTTIGVYALSGFCSALAGVMMTGFSTVSFLNMGLPFLLPSIAVVLVGGTLATGGRGHYVGILGGALLLTAVATLVTGTNIPIAWRDIVFGIVVLGAVLTLRERAH
ncbi:MAG: ABC transporter permease [Proteobacteria bacterium]|nr:ABC transporter permease [Pseudomonadota bacterium]MDA1355268.1 ABC transporter permease [Pseudomonadota bacterium]